jgi:hypothetical protein
MVSAQCFKTGGTLLLDSLKLPSLNCVGFLRDSSSLFFTITTRTHPMIQTEWDELYKKLYDSYDYAALRNEYVRKNLGELLDYMGQYKERFTRPVEA